MKRERKEDLRRLRMLYSLGDFQIALSAVAFLKEADEEERYSIEKLRRFKCYETTMITAYARPFSDSKEGVPKLSLKMCGVTLSNDESHLHERLIHLRNKVFAHSDAEMMRIANRVRTLEIKGDRPVNVFLPIFDEGLFFSTFIEQMRVSELIGKIHFNLYKRLYDEAQKASHSLQLTRDNLEDKGE